MSTSLGGYPGSHDPGQQTAGEVHDPGDRLLANSNRDFAVEVRAGLEAGFGKRRGQPHSHVRLRTQPTESAINPLAEPLRRRGVRPGHQEPLPVSLTRAQAHLREHDHATGRTWRAAAPHRRRRVTLVHQHKPPDHRIERVTAKLDLAKVPAHELDVVKLRLDRPLTRPLKRLLVTLDPDDRTTNTHQLGQKQTDITRAATDIQHPHSALNPGAHQQAAGERRVHIGLATQPLVLVLAGRAQRISWICDHCLTPHSDGNRPVCGSLA